jgi:hypothetical protein
MKELIITLISTLYWIGYYWCETKHDAISSKGTFASFQDKKDWHNWDAGEKTLTLLMHTVAVQAITFDWTYTFLFLVWSACMRFFLHEYGISKFWKDASPFGHISSSDDFSLFLRKIFGEYRPEIMTYPVILSSIVIYAYSIFKCIGLI